MKIAIFGGTHGNEPVGVEVIKALRAQKPKSNFHTYETFIGNPKALEKKVRYIDSDLNRAFGKKGQPIGYELQRSKELEQQIRGKFDLIIDLHTTTTNMGLTAILNNTHKITRQTCCLLKERNNGLKLIEEVDLDEDCNHLGRLAPACVTIEVGPVANNVVSGDLVLKTYQMISDILNFDYKQNFDFEKTEVYKTIETLKFPPEEGWYIHPEIENSDFKMIKKGQPLFINIAGETINYQKDYEAFPFFINEAAYLESDSAMIFAKKTN